MDDKEIIELFFSRSEQAIRETELKYGRLCYSIADNILKDHTEAEECVNDTLLGAWNAIPPQRSDPLRAFLCRIARNIALKRYEYNTAGKRNSRYAVAMEELEECASPGGSMESALESRELARIIESFLDGLTAENRVIFMRRYWFADTCADIAGRVGLSEKNVSVRLTRIRKQLRSHLLEKEVYL